MPERVRPYRVVLLLFAGFIGVNAVTACVLFVRKLGVTPAALERFYLGDEASFTRARTLAGLLETAVPHLLAVPLVIFICAHLVGWLGVLRPRVFALLLRVTIACALVGLAAGFGVRWLWGGLAWVKVAAFVGLEVTLVVWLVLVVLIASALRPSGARAAG